MKKEHKIILGIFIIALIIRIIFVFDSPLKIWDETVYANLGYDLSKAPFQYSLKKANWGDFIPPVADYPYSWPNIGFRAPLLPYSLSVLYFLKLNFLIIFFIPLIGALSTILIYLLGKKLFNEKVGIYSAIFLTLLPLHSINSGMILTEVYSIFFLLLTFISFWKGYEEGNKFHKILFGVFLALSLLTRYTVLWIMPVFLIYFLIKDKSLKFLKDKYLWYSILSFFLIMSPWLIYSYFAYNNPLGAFIHGFISSAYWGGTQEWSLYFRESYKMFSIIGYVFIVSLVYIFHKKEFLKKRTYLLLIWFIFFMALAIYMPHKEERYILLISPVICLLSGFFIDKIKYKKIILLIIMALLLQSNISQFAQYYNKSYTGTNICLLEASNFLKNINRPALILNDEATLLYYYTKQQIRFYPSPLNMERLKNSISAGKENNSYILFTNYNMPLNEDNLRIKDAFDNNFKKIFECNKDSGLSIVYKYQ